MTSSSLRMGWCFVGGRSFVIAVGLIVPAGAIAGQTPAPAPEIGTLPKECVVHIAPDEPERVNGNVFRNELPHTLWDGVEGTSYLSIREPELVRLRRKLRDALKGNDQAAFERAKAELRDALDRATVGAPGPQADALIDEMRALDKTVGPGDSPGDTSVLDELNDAPPTKPSASPQLQSQRPADPAAATFLAMHNRARAEVGVAPLRWNAALAAGAAEYAGVLAQTGRLQHSPRAGREKVRENLLQSLPGTPPAGMVQVWLDERRFYRPGIFPAISSTGNWADAAHYTQMIWSRTTDLGCAVRTGSGFSWLVCRYSPPGNTDGKPVIDAAASAAPCPPPAIARAGRG